MSALAQPPNADQPGFPNSIATNDTRISSNIFQQGNNLRVVQSAGQVINGENHAVICCYEIDETSNALLQTGTISEPISTSGSSPASESMKMFGSIAVTSG